MTSDTASLGVVDLKGDLRSNLDAFNIKKAVTISSGVLGYAEVLT